MTVFRWLIYLLAARLSFTFLNLCLTGRNIRKCKRLKKESGVAYYLARHEKRVREVIVLTVAVVLTILGFSILFPELRHHPPIFSVHLYWFSMPFALLFPSVAFRFTGEKYPSAHKWLAYPCLF